MTSPTLELQGAIVAALKGDSDVTAIVGSRVYDSVPRSTTGSITADFPFVAISGWQELPADIDCMNGSEIIVTIDTWSRAQGMPETHRLSSAVKDALHNAELALTANALVMLEHESTLSLRDQDGITSHAILDFRAVVEQP